MKTDGKQLECNDQHPDRLIGMYTQSCHHQLC